MEIRNIYEDSYGDERLYSVLMDEDELALFSDLEQRAYTWQAASGAIYAGAKGNMSKLLSPAGKELRRKIPSTSAPRLSNISDRLKRETVTRADVERLWRSPVSFRH